ncbi:hypothetical protein D1O30_16960 [Methylocystis hirsuta]|uniref:Glycosyltransferase family 1 protein n=1 Tax=Methylocystis hirsuta TaxID=369798 RepID=A0A3M9XVE0_9HYPH|nr:hypothetical protein D1O30_16960 [Methylocystis hirsuta]
MWAPGPWIIGDSQQRRKLRPRMDRTTLSRRRRAASLQRLRSGLDDAHDAAPGALSWKANGRGAAWRDLFQRHAILVDRSWYMRWLTARPNIKPVHFVHDLIPFEAPEFFRAREAMLHSKRMSKIRRYGAGAVVGSQAVARRLRAPAEATPPIPMLAKIDDFIGQLYSALRRGPELTRGRGARIISSLQMSRPARERLGK